MAVELAENFESLTLGDLEYRGTQLDMYESTIGRGASNATAVTISLRGDTPLEVAEVANSLIKRLANPNQVAIVSTVVTPVVATAD